MAGTRQWLSARQIAELHTLGGSPVNQAGEDTLRPSRTSPILDTARSPWVDCTRGLLIVLVVMMHSTLGVSTSIGVSSWLDTAVAFAQPMRMPAFFLLAGMLSVRTDHLDLREFFDRKVIRFIYFYFLWLAIFIIFQYSHAYYSQNYQSISNNILMLMVFEPPGALWFIGTLPFLHATAKFVFIPKFLGSRWAIWSFLLAYLLHRQAAGSLAGDAHTLSSTWTGWTIVDGYALFLIFFLVGRLLASDIERLMRWAAAAPGFAALLLLVCLGFNLGVLLHSQPLRPEGGLFAGINGAGAMFRLAVLIERTQLAFGLRYLGRNALAIYLAFVFPMAAMRLLAVETGWVTSSAMASLLVTLAALSIPLILERSVRGTAAGFLFVRPNWARLGGSTRDRSSE